MMVVRLSCLFPKHIHSGFKIPMTNRATERIIIALKIVNNSAFTGCTSYLQLRERIWCQTWVSVPHLPQRSRQTGLHCACSTFFFEGWLDCLPLRVSNESLPRPRVARAQKTV